MEAEIYVKYVCVGYMLQGWQLKLVPIASAPTKGTGKSAVTPGTQKAAAGKEYGADLPFKMPATNRSADDVVLALCADHSLNDAVPADDR